MKEIIIVAVFVVAVLFYVFYEVMNRCSYTSNVFRTKAKLIAKFTDEEGCFLCEFEKDGEIVNAIYGFDREGLKVGDEVSIVWNGKHSCIPHVLDEDVYDERMETHPDAKAT